MLVLAVPMGFHVGLLVWLLFILLAAMFGGGPFDHFSWRDLLGLVPIALLVEIIGLLLASFGAVIFGWPVAHWLQNDLLSRKSGLLAVVYAAVCGGCISAAFWAILFGWNADLWINVFFFVCGVPFGASIGGCWWILCRRACLGELRKQ